MLLEVVRVAVAVGGDVSAILVGGKALHLVRWELLLLLVCMLHIMILWKHSTSTIHSISGHSTPLEKCVIITRIKRDLVVSASRTHSLHFILLRSLISIKEHLLAPFVLHEVVLMLHVVNGLRTGADIGGVTRDIRNMAVVRVLIIDSHLLVRSMLLHHMRMLWVHVHLWWLLLRHLLIHAKLTIVLVALVAILLLMTHHISLHELLLLLEWLHMVWLYAHLIVLWRIISSLNFDLNNKNKFRSIYLHILKGSFPDKILY